MRAIVITVVLGLTSSAAWAGTDDLFLSPPSPSPQNLYEAKVVQAYRFLQTGKLDGSLILFRDADAIAPHEAPQFYLLPQIAYLQHRLGKDDEARRTLRVAQLVRSVGEGQVSCPDDSLPGGVVSGSAPLDIRKEVTGRVCGAAIGPIRLDSDYLAKLAALQGMLGD